MHLLLEFSKNIPNSNINNNKQTIRCHSIDCSFINESGFRNFQYVVHSNKMVNKAD